MSSIDKNVSDSASLSRTSSRAANEHAEMDGNTSISETVNSQSRDDFVSKNDTATFMNGTASANPRHHEEYATAQVSYGSYHQYPTAGATYPPPGATLQDTAPIGFSRTVGDSSATGYASPYTGEQEDSMISRRAYQCAHQNSATGITSFSSPVQEYNPSVRQTPAVDDETDAQFIQHANTVTYEAYLQDHADTTLGQSTSDYHSRYPHYSRMSPTAGTMAPYAPLQVPHQDASHQGHQEIGYAQNHAQGTYGCGAISQALPSTSIGRFASSSGEMVSRTDLYGQAATPRSIEGYGSGAHGGDNGSNVVSHSPDDMSQEGHASGEIQNRTYSQSASSASGSDDGHRRELCDDQRHIEVQSKPRYEYLRELNPPVASYPTEVDTANIVATNDVYLQSDEFRGYTVQEQELMRAAYPPLVPSFSAFEQAEGFLDMNALAYYQHNPTMFPKDPRVFNKCVVPRTFENSEPVSPEQPVPVPQTYLPRNLCSTWPSQAVPLQYVQELMGIKQEAETENLELPPRQPFFLANEGITEITSAEVTTCEPIPVTIPYRIKPRYLRGNATEWKLSDIPLPQPEPAIPPQLPALLKECNEDQKKDWFGILDGHIPAYSKKWSRTVAREPGWVEARNARRTQMITKIPEIIGPLFSTIPDLFKDHEVAMSKGLVGSKEIETIDAVRKHLEGLLRRYPKKELHDVVKVESSAVKETIEKGAFVYQFTKKIVAGEDWDGAFEEIYGEEDGDVERGVEGEEQGVGSGERAETPRRESAQKSAQEPTLESTDECPSLTHSLLPGLSPKSSFDVEEFGSVSVSEKSSVSFRISQLAKPEAVTASSPIEELEQTLNDSFHIELTPFADPIVPTTASRELFVSMLEENQPEPTKLKMKDRVKAKVHRLKEKFSFRSRKV